MKNTINDVMKNAMRSGDKETVAFSRFLLSQIKNIEIEQRGKEVKDSQIISLISKLIKQRREMMEMYYAQNRSDLLEREKAELNFLEQFQPAPLTTEEIEKIVRETITDLNASSPQDMGKVMKVVMEKTSGRAEGRLISDLVKKTLTQ